MCNSSSCVYLPEDDTAEDLDRYEPGGYHPVIIGDIIRSPTGTSSYRILHKLGYGSFATVWLADHNRSDLAPKYVAVKVSTADGKSASEADFLQSVPSPYIIPVFDSFAFTGPNGQSHILVTETLLPFVDFLRRPRLRRTTRRLIWELVNAVQDLHEAGLVHGDISLANVGVTLPQIQKLDHNDLACELEYPISIPIILTDMSKATTSIPRFITQSCDKLKDIYKHSEEDDLEMHTKLFDFGCVRKDGDSTKFLQCMRLSRSPEIVYAVEVEKVDMPLVERPSDIWALGTLTYQIITGGKSMFYYGALSEMIRIAGNPPPHWNRSILKPDYEGTPDMYWDKEWHSLRKSCEDDADCNLLVNLLRRIFVFDPSKRPLAADISKDDWLSSVDV